MERLSRSIPHSYHLPWRPCGICPHGAIESQDVLVSRVPPGLRATPGIQMLADGRPVAVNVDPRESSTAVMTPAEFQAAVDRDAAGDWSGP